jgi:tripartite-type tricarboxylate transporter receptor subunit TctC
MRRRPLLAAPALLLPTAANAQPAWPERPVTIINPFAPGGQTEPLGRLVAQHLQRALGQPFVLESRAGAGGTIGAGFVARAPADGHTLLLGTTSTYVVAPFLFRPPPYDPLAAFAPVAVLSEGPMVLITHPRTGWRSVEEVLAAARARPGGVSLASAGNGSLPHVIGEFFASLAGVRLNHIPYRGGAPALNDVIGGQVDLFFEILSNVTAHAEAGRVVPLLTSGAARAPALPQVPTAAEAGLPALSLTSWAGLAAPAGTPASIIAALNREVNAALRSEEARALVTRMGIATVGGSAEDMAARIAREAPLYRRIITDAGVSAA